MIVLDGPMGTELAARGVSTDGPAWSAGALESSPDVVGAIHASYVAAGADVHRTNTFRTQPRLFPDRWRALVARAVRLAREAGARRVAGSIAPVFDCYRPDLSPPPDVARRAHAALAEELAGAGVDLLVCETFPHAGEARIAVEEAVKTGRPTWIALTAGPEGTLFDPPSLADAARACLDAGASAVLVCCTAARKTLPYVEALAGLGAACGAYANAGAAEDGLGWGAPAPGAAALYADLATTWIDAGASIVGACCGTGPAHVAAINALRLARG